MFNDAITHVVKTRRIFDAPEKSDMMLNRVKDEYRYRTWAQGGHEERGGCVVKEGKQNGEVGGGRSEGEEKRFLGRGQCKRGGGSRSSCGRSKGSSC